MKTEAWTLFSVSIPRKGEGDSSMKLVRKYHRVPVEA